MESFANAYQNGINFDPRLIPCRSLPKEIIGQVFDDLMLTITLSVTVKMCVKQTETLKIYSYAIHETSDLFKGIFISSKIMQLLILSTSVSNEAIRK